LLESIQIAILKRRTHYLASAKIFNELSSKWTSA